LISRLEEFQSHFRKFHNCSDAGSCKDDINGDDDRADTRPWPRRQARSSG
jgi:hypothetical protein